MKLIENLEDLIVGDWIKIYVKGYFNKSEDNFKIAEITKINIIELQIKTQERKSLKAIIHKHKLKQKKRKLKHKSISYNDDYIIFKLSKNETNKMKNEHMLKELEK